jgi:DNA-binding CsgD family transcriptional regulator
METGGLQIGRDVERERLESLLRDSAAGRPGALLVAGEPGIGKTSLVAEVTSGPAAAGHLVLWGRCLRFGAESSPYLPIGQVLTQWHRQADSAERARVLDGAKHLATIAPALGTDAGPAEAARVVPLVASVVDRIAERASLVLVVDDVQWSDGTSLDLLAYLIAGFAPDQRLCVLVTYRDTELGEGHRLHGWLADCTRLPSVSHLRLERLGFADAEELVARVGTYRGELGRLAAEVFRRAEGNPYYTALLAAGSGEPDSEGDLSRTLLSAWHRLPTEARELLQLLALGGRPVPVDLLERLVVARGGTAQQVVESLTASTEAGLVAVTRSGSAWFHHPLIAEVVATTLRPSSRTRVHRQYCQVLVSATDLPLASRAAHLALHHDGAEEPNEAFAWSLRAADEALAVRGHAEHFEHLQRACELWGRVGAEARGAAGDRVDLWERASESAWSAGEYVPALRLREEAIAMIDPRRDPVRAVRLRMPVAYWREASGLEPARVEAVRPVADLAADGCPGTPEHARALARLAFVEISNDQHESAALHAAEALSVALRTGSKEALAWAYCLRSQTRLDAGAGLADVLEARALADAVGDPELIGVIASRGANCFERLGRRTDAAELVLTTFRRLVETSSAHDAMWSDPAFGVALLIELGRWGEARGMLRELLSRRWPPGHAAEVRGQAATLAFRSGDLTAGRTHLDRAYELQPVQPSSFDLLAWVDIEALHACGELPAALQQAAALMEGLVQLDPTFGDELLPLAARIAGDLAEQPGRGPQAQTLLERIERIRGTEPDRFVPADKSDLLHPAWAYLFAAERARCFDQPDPVPLWEAAVSAACAAGLAWDQTVASFQLARALLAGRRSRREAATALRDARRLATDLGAAGVLADVEYLARQAHIPLDEPTPAVPDAAPSNLPASLTPREREVLSHLVAGSTYAEMAKALFISEKTVSAHVSNLLRKTGTSSRIELAALVRQNS